MDGSVFLRNAVNSARFVRGVTVGRDTLQKTISISNTSYALNEESHNRDYNCQQTEDCCHSLADCPCTSHGRPLLSW